MVTTEKEDDGEAAKFSIGYSTATTLAHAGLEHGASEAELAALKRLQDFEGERVDVERLERLATMAGLPWRRLFPELERGLDGER